MSLLPMGRNDTAAFIAQWHDAARAESQEETEHLDQLQRSLLETVSSNPSIARLAENPLMCALICALHRDQQARLPQDRKSLYDSALELLLVRRDTHRSIQAPEGIELSKEAQLRLLSRIAAWLILQRQSEADQEDVVDGILAEILPGIREAQRQGSAPDILRYLLVRSGVLHAPTEDSVAFIHRSFQDYLGAKALQENRYCTTMVRSAHENQWEDVIRMAVAHADRRQCSQLLSKLIKRGDDVRKHRHRLHILAAACLEDATELDPEVRTSIEDRLAALVPPRTFEEATSLAAAGSVVLPLLPQGPDGLTDEEAAAVVSTALQIGGDPALPLLAKYRHHGIGSASYETCGVRNIARWAGLKHLALPAVGLRHEDHTELAQLPALESLNLAGESIASLRGRPPLPGISHLAITDATHTDDLAPLRECFPDLTRLSLFFNPGHAPTLKLAPLRTMKNLIVQVSNAGSVLDAASFPEGRAIITPRP